MVVKCDGWELRVLRRWGGLIRELLFKYWNAIGLERVEALRRVTRVMVVITLVCGGAQPR